MVNFCRFSFRRLLSLLFTGVLLFSCILFSLQYTQPGIVQNSVTEDASFKVRDVQDVQEVQDVANPHPFKYLINSEFVCKDVDPFILVYVHTSPRNLARRMFIRQTWGNQKYYSQDVNIRVVFMLGDTNGDKKLQDSLEYEAGQYNDIIQEDFIDSYRNLTYKAVAGLKWINTHCQNAKFIMKTDDDIFVNTFSLIPLLREAEAKGEKNLLMCTVWNNMKVMRKGKWKIEKSEYPEKVYPRYCSGSAFTMTPDVAKALYDVSYQVPFFWVDDVYITGLLPKKLANDTVNHKQMVSKYYLKKNSIEFEKRFTGPEWSKYLFAHSGNLNTMLKVWDKIVQFHKGEAHPQVQSAALPSHLNDKKNIK